MSEAPIVVSRALRKDVLTLQRKRLSPGQIAREIGIRQSMVEAILSGQVEIAEERAVPRSRPAEPSLAEIFDQRLYEARQRRALAGRAYTYTAMAKVCPPSESDEMAIRKSMEFLAKLDPKIE